MQNLAIVGTLGWLLVVPPLLGALAGRWLDRRYGTGVFWSASLIFVGVVAGGAMVWRRMNQE
jgi:ATP synthase protein I